MTEYKKNHTVPKFMLKSWIDSETKHRGVHVYDIRKERRYVSTGQGGSAFSFAIEDDLHIPIVDGERAVAVEQWLSRLESGLSYFIRQVSDKSETITLEAQHYTEALMAILALEFRSRYNLQMIQRELEQNSSLAQDLSSGDGTGPKKFTLENLIHIVTECMAYIRPAKMMLFHAPRGRSWIICDRPCIGSQAAGYRLVPLTNKVLLRLQPSDDGTDIATHIDARDELVDQVNTELALNARDWIVADSVQTVEQYGALTRTELWRHRAEEDHLTTMPIRHLTTGYSITE